MTEFPVELALLPICTPPGLTPASTATLAPLEMTNEALVPGLPTPMKVALVISPAPVTSTVPPLNKL